MTDKATPTPSPATPIQVTVLKPSIWMESGMAGDRHIMVQYSDDAPFEYAALFYRYGYTDNATIHRAATEIAVSIGASEPVEERQRPIRAEAERLAAQAAPTEPPQEFESAQGRALASAWAEGWAQCRDAEYVGEEAESEAFNQSATLAQCLHADQTRFQGGLSNDQLRRAWSAKLPNVIPTDEQLTAFALGIEAAAQPSQAPVVQAVQTEVRFKYESMKPIDGYDAIYAEYATTFGRYPDDFMSRVVRQTKEDLFMWWGAHREKIRAGLVLLAAQEDASSGATTQAVRMLTREELNDVALSEQVGWEPGEYVEAVQRKFAEVNGLRIPADGKIGDV